MLTEHGLPRRVASAVGRRLPAGVRSAARAAVVDEFHRMYYDQSARTWANTRWLGVDVQKCPLDLWVYQELLVRLRPELVVETGTFAGGSALFLASCMDMIGAGRVLTVDVADRSGRPEHSRITYLTGSSTDPGVIERVSVEARAASPLMLILDSDHSCAHVLDELRAYAGLVTPGSYLIVEDTNVNGHPVTKAFGPGPWEAIDAFLAEGAPFERDASCEKYFMTFNPGGYLRRVG